ncbi:cyanobactin maturation protease PatG family protein [Streptomyces sp. MS191]|uniref:cyanobactin maturation protease PatG family protein n=1 Tax=Streptomyces sp. ms191 TaxID=1827978 RepID=UPI0021C6440F|nr:hypothetical protein [Streptomyces sp. ms191]
MDLDTSAASHEPTVTPAAAENGPLSRMTAEPTEVPAPPPQLDTGAPPERVRQFVYAIGRIDARFPSLSVEKEFAQATGRAETAQLTDRQAAQAVLSDPANRYLARRMCWVLTIEGMDTYLLVPRDETDLDLLLGALRPSPSRSDTDVVIGTLGPLAPSEKCGGLVVPMVVFDQIYSFDTESFIAQIPPPDEVDAGVFLETASELFDRITQLADNAGNSDEHRALNYLTMRYPEIYAATARQHARNSSLTDVEAFPSPLSGVRTVITAVFTYTDRNTNFVEKFAAQVDTTEVFPFLATPGFNPYYDH